MKFLWLIVLLSSSAIYSEIVTLESGWTFQREGETIAKPVLVGVPLIEQGYKVPIRGKYRLKIFVPVLPEYSQAIYMDRLHSADQTFWNGKYIGSTGSFTPNYYPYWHKVRYYEIPISILKLGENELVVDVECRETQFRCGLFRSVPIFGNQDQIKDKMVFEDVYQIVIAALFFGIFLQQGIGYALNRSSKSGIYLAGTAILFVGWRLPVLNKIHFLMVSPEILVRLLFFCQFVFPVFILLFVYTLFDRRLTKLAVITFFLDVVLGIIQLFPMDPDSRFYLVYLWYILLAVKVPILVQLLAKNYKKTAEAVVVSLGALVATFFGIADVITDVVTGKNDYLTQYGILTFLFSGVLAIALQSARTKRELRNLNESLEMLVTLRTQELHKQFKLLHDDLVIAAGLQSKLIPPMEFEHHSLSVASVFMPMEKIGGDYFDYYIHEDSSISFLLCDVLGHGIAAALIASMLKVNFLEIAPKEKDPGAFLLELNQKMLPVVEKNYITAVACHFDLERLIMKYSVMGHPSPFIMNVFSHTLAPLTGRGPIMGWKKDVLVETFSRKLEVGDRFFFYTDGITESQNKRRELYGESRLKGQLVDGLNLSIHDLNEKIKKDIRKFAFRLSDDVTYFTIDIK
ncbi:PP2C family protein-serine/threonine phosphatase [Leptospira bandrabouensis]|uniref:Serine/threonine-protein phosphatase n=1 Tax=Leptospira bandrabouensis TaxID=2484903 RepID=A0A6H3P3T0_9LEPT|nr:PP2C family protein-serine/threonine phosphatase [Leptospira bandrabouensis]MCG6153333.1 serine/threonine-protein phosphatase [Leptospira bandrabouensis]TGN06081.1 serine/threonine-protein phosphatase [Leptospira bandrabouensis]TGN16415.1 serine/threonine-protein phosphatase [Leptospira bandrabouensis]